MTYSQKEFLYLLGWDDFFESHLPSHYSNAAVPARIVCEERGRYRVQHGKYQAVWSTVAGKLQFNSSSRADLPAVGDWVLVEICDQSERGVIHYVFPRRTMIYRKQVGSSFDIQILATNVDYIFVMTSINSDLNFRRLERYLAVACDSGAVPIILLSKADTCPNGGRSIKAEVEKEFPGVPVYTLCKDSFKEAEFLHKYLQVRKTSVFIGSSGVGKSTLINFLTGGHQKIKTKAVREHDGRGRHTTTSRNLYASHVGGVVIDTPGMRELQLFDHAEGLGAQFTEIEALIERCRFNDCRHESEPGCAIKQALGEESLSLERWKSYSRLQAAVQEGARRKDEALAAKDKKSWKKASVASRKIGRKNQEGSLW